MINVAFGSAVFAVNIVLVARAGATAFGVARSACMEDGVKITGIAVR